MRDETTSRRKFIKSAAAAALAPTIIPASALGADGHVAPSNRIIMGAVGVGGRGSHNMRTLMRHDEVRFVAVCDVDAAHRADAKRQIDDWQSGRTRSGVYRGVSETGDFREILERDDIDAVCIGTPDHWHAIPVIGAARAGKDMYCEKPLSLTIEQGRAMSDAVRRNGVVFQTGSQQRSDEKFRSGCELVRNGRIGKLHTVQVGLPGGSTAPPGKPIPVPQGFDYDFWLGPAPEAPYTDNRCHWNFRWILDYSGGQLTDWGAHHCDIAQWGMDTERTGPVEIEGQGKYPADGLWNAATSYQFKCVYASGVVMEVGTHLRGGVTFIGDEGRVWVNRGAIEADPAWLLDEVIGPNEIHLYDSPDHHADFIACVKSRREPVAPIEVAHRSISISHLGNICMQLGRKLRWDPDRERFIGDAEADRKLSRSMRGPWRL